VCGFGFYFVSLDLCEDFVHIIETNKTILRTSNTEPKIEHNALIAQLNHKILTPTSITP
jgi:hypothetical protein